MHDQETDSPFFISSINYLSRHPKVSQDYIRTCVDPLSHYLYFYLSLRKISLSLKKKLGKFTCQCLFHSLIFLKFFAGGFDSVAPSGMQTVTGLAEARGTVLSLKLDKMSDSVSGQTVVDPKGYLTDLNSLKISSDAEIGDIKKVRFVVDN